MPALHKQFTIHFEPQGDHLVVTVPEIGVTVETAAGEMSLDAATAAGRRAITAHLEATRKKRRPRRQEQAKAPRASA
jgi:hypothetical protein